jgi:hydroxypyruvate isomerase
LCQAAVKLGLQAMDLLEPKDWPVAQKYGLKLTVVPGPTSIPDGLNRKENHDGIEQRFREDWWTGPWRPRPARRSSSPATARA